MFIALETSILKKKFFSTLDFLKKVGLCLSEKHGVNIKQAFALLECHSKGQCNLHLKFSFQVLEVFQIMQDWFNFWLDLLNSLFATFSRTGNECIKPLCVTLYSQCKMNEQALSFFMHEIQMDTQNILFLLQHCLNFVFIFGRKLTFIIIV